jgi:hypothetical protein
MLHLSPNRNDLLESTTVVVDAAPEAIEAAFARVDLAAPIGRALAVLDLDGRFALLPARVGAMRYGAVWRIEAGQDAARIAPERFESFSRPGYVKASWDVEVVSSDAGTLLSIDSDFAPTDERTAARLLDAWTLIGPLSHSLREHAAHALTDLAEQDADE